MEQLNSMSDVQRKINFNMRCFEIVTAERILEPCLDKL